MKQFDFKRVTAVKCVFTDTETNEKLTGKAAIIADLLLCSENYISLEDISKKTHSGHYDYFTRRSIEVFLNKVKRFFKVKGYAIDFKKNMGYRLVQE